MTELAIRAALSEPKQLSGRAYVIVNPAAQNGAAGKRWPRLAARAGELGIELESVFTEAPGHATELARAAAADGRELVCALGRGRHRQRGRQRPRPRRGAAGPELAILPFGTGRDTIRTYGIPKQAERALELLRGGRTRTIDLGRATFRTRLRRGLALVHQHRLVRPDGRRRGARGAHLEAARRNARRSCTRPSPRSRRGATSVHASRSTTSRRSSCVANNVICANGRAFGGGIKICPQAEPDDGLLDVLVWGDVGKLDLALNLPRLYRGTHLGHAKVTVLRARRVHVEPERPLPARARRRAARHDPGDVRGRPAALRLRVPA